MLTSHVEVERRGKGVERGLRRLLLRTTAMLPQKICTLNGLLIPTPLPTPPHHLYVRNEHTMQKQIHPSEK